MYADWGGPTPGIAVFVPKHGDGDGGEWVSGIDAVAERVRQDDIGDEHLGLRRRQVITRELERARERARVGAGLELAPFAVCQPNVDGERAAHKAHSKRQRQQRRRLAAFAECSTMQCSAQSAESHCAERTRSHAHSPNADRSQLPRAAWHGG